MSTCCTDYYAPDVYNEKWPKAVKEHKCCECGKVIVSGEQYQYIRTLYDGMWDTAKTCEACADLRDSLAELWCPELGGLRGAYQEYLEETGRFRYDEELDQYIYPDNHMGLNAV